MQQDSDRSCPGCSPERFGIDDLTVADGIKIFQDGLSRKPAAFIEEPGRFVLDAGGGLGIEDPSAVFRNERFRLFKQASAQPPAAPGVGISVRTLP